MRKLDLLLSFVVLTVAAACGDDLPAMPDSAGQPDARVDANVTPDAMTDASSPDARIDAAPVDMDIRDLQMQVVATGSEVRVADVIVTARGDVAGSSTALFIQEPSGPAPWSGIFVFVDTNPPPPFSLPNPGDIVTVTGTVQEFTRAGQPGSRTNIDMVTNIMITGTGAPIPAPSVVQEGDLVFTSPEAEQWEGVLVRVEGVTVASQDSFGEFTLTGGLKVDDRLFAYTQPLAGDSFAAITGPLDHDFGTSRLLPRGPGDLEGLTPGPPVLIDLSPPTISIGEGMAVTYTVTIDRLAPPGGTTIAVDTSDPMIAAPMVMSVTVPELATTATFDVAALTFGGPVDVTATLDTVTLTATMTVLAGPDPLLLGINPNPVNVMAGGGTAVLIAQLDRVAPAGGQLVTLSNTDPVALIMPPEVTVPAGQTSAGFRVRADGTVATTSPIVITATVPSSSVTGDVNIVTTAAVPATGDVIINEVNYDVPATGGDTNCDGITSNTEAADEFVELVNFTDSPLLLTGMTISDTMPSTSVRFTFPAFTLGSGEMVVVFGGALGNMTGLHPWCTNTDGSHIGDARALAGSALGLTNAGDGVVIDLGGTMLDSTSFGAGADVSETRSPDFTGAFIRHTMAPGHATDRNWTPGTLLTGDFLALANPTPPPPPPDAGIPDAGPDAGIDADLPDAAPPADPAVTAITSPISVMSGGGFGILEVTLDVAAPAGGASVMLSSSDPGSVAVPASVIVPAGATQAGFRVRGDAVGAASATITATRNGSVMATVNVVTMATAPTMTGQLVINEFLSDPPPTVIAGGDANCDGVRNGGDEFVEIANRSGLPLNMNGVSFWDQTARTGGTPIFSFGAINLGPGEVVVIFATAAGTTGTSAWCVTPVPVTAGRIGDAAAFNTPGGVLSLNNAGDTLSITATAMTSSTELALTTYGAEYDTDQSGTRSPDFTGAFITFTTAPGRAADRTISPGSLLTGAPFSSANP